MKNKTITIRVSEKEKQKIQDYTFSLGFDDNSKFILYCIEKEIIYNEKMKEALR